MVAPQPYIPPETARRRRRAEHPSPRTLLVGASLALVTVAFLLFYCSQRALIAQQGYELDRLGAEMAALEAETASLRVEIQRQQAPERLRSWAISRGYKVRDRVEYVELPSLSAPSPRQVVAYRPPGAL